jgi:hypothetical protein
VAVAERAAEPRARDRMRTPGAIHSATGVHHGAAWVVSNDPSFRRLAGEGLKVWLFDDHV